MGTAETNLKLLYGAYNGSLKVVREALQEGAEINCEEVGTSLTALHLAVGRSHLDVVKFLVEEEGAAIVPDGYGRWPTVIAAQCRASEEMCDYIVECEGALADTGPRS